MIRMIVALALGIGLFSVVAWRLEVGPFSPNAPTGPTNPGSTATPVNLGDFLYPPAPYPAEKAAPLTRRADPITVYGTLSPIDKIDISAEAEGRLLMIGPMVPDGAVQAAGAAAFLVEPFYPIEIPQPGNNKQVQVYQRLYEGSVLEKNQLISLVNPARALSDVAKKSAQVKLAIADKNAAKALAEEYKKRFEREEYLFSKNASSQADLGAAKATWDKGKAELVSKEEGISAAEADLRQSETNLRYHEIRNAIPVRKSIIRTLYKKGGENVKAGDPVAQLYSLDRLLAEGFLEIQYNSSNRVREGTRVTIEPTYESEPKRAIPGHRKAVTAITVTNFGPPLAVSASEDRTVKVWSGSSIGPVLEFTHHHPVRAVACPPAVLGQNLVLAGDDGGYIRLWDLDTKKARFEKRAYDENTPVTALAFTPDGKFFATGSATGLIKIWETESFKEAWAIDAAHGADENSPPHTDVITSMHFTPQCRLVTASRDNTVRVWEVHENGVKLVYDPIPDRSGGVALLGVSADGRYMLFDQKNILQLLSVEDGKMINYVKNPQGANTFEAMAVFSPDGSMILTGGAPDGKLQLWRTPTPTERGYELRQFTPEERGRATCAAFAPLGVTGQSPFAVSGDNRGYVYLWPIPSKEEALGYHIAGARVTHVSTNLDTGSHQVRIGVDVPNPTGRLLPGRPVTIVID